MGDEKYYIIGRIERGLINSMIKLFMMSWKIFPMTLAITLKNGYHTPYGDINLVAIKDLLISNVQRDMYARDYAAYSIEKAGAKSEDIIITSDADEIINPLFLQIGLV